MSSLSLSWFRIAAAVALLALTACGGPESRYQSYLARGKSYLAQGRLDRAGVELRNALQIEPKAAEALYLGGEVAERRGNLRAALGFYQAALDARADYPQAAGSLARLYAGAGFPDRALKLVEPALARHPDDPDLLVSRAAARAEQKNTVGARADVERALHFDPDNTRGIGLLAGLDRAAGDDAAAIELVSAAAQRKPGSVELHEVLAGLYFDTHKPADGERQLRRLIELRPHDSHYRYQLALYLARSHQTDAAQQVLEDFVKATPDSDEPKLALADFVAAQRSLPQGEAVLRGFIAYQPKDYDLRLGLGALQERRGAAADALRTYTEVADLDRLGPQGLTARDRMAQIEASAGHDQAATQLIAAVLAENPRDDDALKLRGELALQRNDPLAAIGDLRAVLRDHPEASGLRRVLARAYLADGEPALAEQALRAAIDSAPRSVGARVELAQLLARTHRADEGITLLEETVRSAPGDAQPREELARAYMARGDWAAAHQAVEDLEVLRPADAVAAYLAGQIAAAQKRPDDAERDYGKALALQPNSLDALGALARLELARGRGPQAIARVQSAVARDPTNAQPLDLLAELYLKSGDLTDAQAALQRAVGLAPNWWVPYHGLALVKLAAHDGAAAVAEYQAGLKALPAQPDLSLELAALYEKQGQVDAAIAALDTVYRANPHSPVAANTLAKLLVTYKSDAASLARAHALTETFASSDDGELLDTSGWVQFKRGEYAEALPLLERAAQRAPESREIRYHVAMAELQAGQRDRARSNLEFALSGAARFLGADAARTALASLKGAAG